jgi:hypothetical protein
MKDRIIHSKREEKTSQGGQILNIGGTILIETP